MAGFAEMEEEDRVALFRQGSFEVIMARYTPLLTSDGMFTPDMTVLIPRYSYSIYAPRFKSSFIALFLSFYFISWAVVDALLPFCPAHCEMLLLVIADCWSKIKRKLCTMS